MKGLFASTPPSWNAVVTSLVREFVAGWVVIAVRFEADGGKLKPGGGLTGAPDHRA